MNDERFKGEIRWETGILMADIGSPFLNADGGAGVKTGVEFWIELEWLFDNFGFDDVEWRWLAKLKTAYDFICSLED